MAKTMEYAAVKYRRLISGYDRMVRDSWTVKYVVGIYDHTLNKCTYLQPSTIATQFGDLSTASPKDSDTANTIVENNIYKRSKVVYKKNRKIKQLFVSKVFYNKSNHSIKLTKHNAFQLMEIVANNI